MEQTMNMTLGSLSPSEIVEIKNQLMLLQDQGRKLIDIIATYIFKGAVYQF